MVQSPGPGALPLSALWVGATLLARSGCQNAVLGALQSLGLGWHTTRQYLREWLRDGADRAAPCRVQLDVQACFAPLLRWVLAWWESPELTLAIDPTSKGEALVALPWSSASSTAAWPCLRGRVFPAPRASSGFSKTCPVPRRHAANQNGDGPD